MWILLMRMCLANLVEHGRPQVWMVVGRRQINGLFPRYISVANQKLKPP